jgi:hypothetical protein
MNDPGPLPELTWLPIDRLHVDPVYQRTLESRRSQMLIERIAEKFSWAAFGAIMACPDGAEDWLIVDGQHRTEGARKRGDIPRLPAVVIELAQHSQADAFVRANDRLPVNSNALFHAKVIAGDPEALAIDRLCKQAKIAVTRYPIGAVRAPVNTTAGIGAIYHVLRKYGEARLGRTLGVLSTAFRDQRGGLAPNLIRGCADVMAIDIDPSSVISALRNTGIINLLRASLTERGASLRDRAVCEAIRSAQRHVGVLPPTTAGIDRARLMAGR